MIKEYNQKSFLFGVPGLVLQVLGRFMMDPSEGSPLGLLLTLTGTTLLLVGLSFYARAKGRHPAWCLMAFLSIIGLAVLAFLKDKTQAI